MVIIQTRWHHDDLAGWLLREHPEENWEVLNLPAIAEADGDGRKEGEALWPEQYPIKTLEGIDGIGGATWAALYQQRPTAAEGEVFKREWWQRYSEFPQFRRIVQSWDTAFKTALKTTTACARRGAKTKTGYYLLHAWRARVEFPQLKRQVAALAEEWKPSAILVEDKASGQSLIQELKQGSRFPILAIKVDKDKLARAYSASPLVEAGKVFLPASAPWLTDLLYELCVFPAGAHDDSVDSVTQALNWMARQGCNGLFDYYADEGEKAREAMKPQPGPPKPRVWSEQVRMISMGIPALADPEELDAWIEFLEGMEPGGERLEFARTQRMEAVSTTVQ